MVVVCGSHIVRGLLLYYSRACSEVGSVGGCNRYGKVGGVGSCDRYGEVGSVGGCNRYSEVVQHVQL